MCWITNNLSNIGLVIDIIGAMLMFVGAEKVSYSVILYRNEEHERLDKKAKRKNNIIKLGALLLVVGFVLQFIGNNIK